MLLFSNEKNRISPSSFTHRSFLMTLTVLSLGYLIDFFDLTIFAVVRADILRSFNVSQSEFMHVSSLMFNSQALGIMLGGLVSGIWADKIGRLSAVRMGIFIYSLSILFSAYTTNMSFFIFLRFIAGVGLAGELAASVTLISEMSLPKYREVSSATIYFFGVIGGIFATYIGAYFSWQQLFITGSVAGFILLIFRMSIADSIMFTNMKKTATKRGSLSLLFFNNTKSFLKLISLIFLLVPFWFMVFFVNFAPEVGKEMGVSFVVQQGKALAFFFIGSLLGSYVLSFIAKFYKSRKKSIFLSLFAMICAVSLFSLGSYMSSFIFYFTIFLLGFACGYPSVYMTLAAESYGTNQRATATSFVSCAGRGSLVLINAIVPFAISFTGSTFIGSMIVSCVIFFISLSILFYLPETSGKSLDFIEIKSI